MEIPHGEGEHWLASVLGDRLALQYLLQKVTDLSRGAQVVEDLIVFPLLLELLLLFEYVKGLVFVPELVDRQVRQLTIYLAEDSHPVVVGQAFPSPRGLLDG